MTFFCIWITFSHVLVLFLLVGLLFSDCNTKQQNQTQLQPHILGSDVKDLMKYPVPINLSPEGDRRLEALGQPLIKCS